MQDWVGKYNIQLLLQRNVIVFKLGMMKKLNKLIVVLVMACSLSACDFLLFDPKGPIAAEQMELIILSFLVMMIVVVPVIFMTFWFSIKYRDRVESTSEYLPNWEHSNKIEAIVWSVPLIIIAVLGVITYQTSFSLDPRQALASDKDTLRIQVVALDWKWLFIYPEQEIATVNEVALPVDTPVEFLITSDTVMNSFFVPQLGSMIYAMAGMENQLYLVADQAGEYRGMSANYSGFGFSGMKFKALAKSDADFDQWVSDIKALQSPLDQETYSQLSDKTKDHPVEHYSSVHPLMFNRIIEKYTGKQDG